MVLHVGIYMILGLFPIGFGTIISNIIILIYSVSFVCHLNRRCTRCTNSVIGFFKSLRAYKMIKFGIFKEGTTEGEIKLFNYIVPEFFFVQLVVFVMIVITSTTGVFWLTFLIESSNQCNPTALDCFPMNYDLSQSSIDCSEFPNITDITCFWFTLDFGRGFTEALGFLTVNLIIFSTITWLLLTISVDEMEEG